MRYYIGVDWADPPNDRARLEQLCRYLLRPPLAQHRVHRPMGASSSHSAAATGA